MRAPFIILALIGLGGCETVARIAGAPPEQVLMATCRDFAATKIQIAQEINLDAVRPETRRRFTYADLAAIRTASWRLTGLCPPPEGFRPYDVTVSAAQTALDVLTAYRPPLTPQGERL